MKPKVFSERATLTIKKDKAGETASVVEEKHFKSKWEALDYCKRRMDEIRARERKEAEEIGYDPFGQLVGHTSDFIPKKDDMFDYFVSRGIGGIRRNRNHRTRRNAMNCEEYIIKRLTSLESENETLHKLLSMKQAEINAAKSQTGEAKTEIKHTGSQEANGIGETMDVVTDKKGREWPIIRLHEGIYGFRDCPFYAKYNESGKNGPFEKSDAYKATIKWLDENMTHEQRERWGEPFLASLYNIMGRKAHELTEPVEGEIQFDYYKDWHNRIKSCPDLYDEDQTEFGSWYWTDSPYSGDTGSVCGVDSDGNAYYNVAIYDHGVAPCFAIKSLNLACSETADRPSGEEA